MGAPGRAMSSRSLSSNSSIPTTRTPCTSVSRRRRSTTRATTPDGGLCVAITRMGVGALAPASKAVVTSCSNRSAVDGSAQCRSSTMRTIGLRLAARTAPRHAATIGATGRSSKASTGPSTTAGAGSTSRPPSPSSSPSGASAVAIGRYGTVESSRQWPTSTTGPDALASLISSPRSRVLPTPASPSTNTRAAVRRASSSAIVEEPQVGLSVRRKAAAVGLSVEFRRRPARSTLPTPERSVSKSYETTRGRTACVLLTAGSLAGSVEAPVHEPEGVGVMLRRRLAPGAVTDNEGP